MTLLDMTLVYPRTGQRVRMVGSLQDPRWVAKDVCDILKLGGTSAAVSRLDDDEKGATKVDTPGGEQNLLTVNRFGLYSLILGSRKAGARAFKRWVTHEVLPALEKISSYTLPATERPVADVVLHLRFDEEGQVTLTTVASEPERRDEPMRKDSAQNGGFNERASGGIPVCLAHPWARVGVEKRAIAPAIAMEIVTLSERCRERGQEASLRQLQAIGRVARKLYYAKHGCDPVLRDGFFGGAACRVRAYSRRDLDIIDAAIDAVLGPSNAMAKNREAR